MKKLSSIAVLATFLAVTACSKEGQGATAKAPTAPAEPAKPAEPAEPLENTPPAEPVADGGATSGIPECDALADAYDKLAMCEALGPAADSLKEAAAAFRTSMASWGEMPPEGIPQIKDSCVQALASFGSYREMGCEI